MRPRTGRAAPAPVGWLLVRRIIHPGPQPAPNLPDRLAPTGVFSRRAIETPCTASGPLPGIGTGTGCAHADGPLGTAKISRVVCRGLREAPLNAREGFVARWSMTGARKLRRHRFRVRLVYIRGSR